MSKIDRSDEALRASIQRSAMRLIRNLRENPGMPKNITLLDLACLVSSARELFGRRRTDRAINARQQEEDLLKAGICLDCMKRPSVTDDDLCVECGKEADALEQAVMNELAIEEFEKMEPQGKKPS